MECVCRGRWGDTNLTLQGIGEKEGGGCVFIRWVDAGLLHAVRQVGLTGGIRQDAGWLSVEGCLRGGSCGSVLFRNPT